MPVPARILTALGNHGLAVDESGTGERSPEPFEVRFRRAVGRPLPGDLVEVDDDGGVSAVLPRRNVFGRGVRGRFRPLAANLDRLLIVVAPHPSPSRALLHRYLAAARMQDVEPAIVINKADLPVPDAPPFTEIERLAVPVFRTRAAGPPDLDGLPASLAGGVHLLAGQSGTGKTSLANALVPDLAAQTEGLSRTTGKGRHTTTSARLLRLAGGGWLIDTPGVWEYELWRMPADELARGFPEFDAYAGRCRFRDCLHRNEPDCAVREAARADRIPEFRLDAWHALLDEQQRLSNA